MKHELHWHQTAWEDYLYWLKTDKSKLEKINELIKAIDTDPFRGIGKPEPLQHAFKGFWSRRIDREHRLIYCIDNKSLTIVSCRYHYEN